MSVIMEGKSHFQFDQNSREDIPEKKLKLL